MAAGATCTNLQVAASACQVRRVKQSALKFQEEGKNAIVSFFFLLLLFSKEVQNVLCGQAHH